MTVSRSYRMNLGNYESAETFISMTAEVDELDTPEAVAEELACLVEQESLRRLVAKTKKRQPGKKVDPAALARQFGIEA